MKWFIEGPRGRRGRASMLVLPAALTALVIAAAPPVAPAGSRDSILQPRVLANWPFVPPSGSFAEGLALGPDGYLYASVTTWSKKSDHNIGQIWKVSPQTGAKTAFGPRIQIGPALLSGVAFDRQGRLFVGKASFGGPSPSAVYRVDGNSAVRVLVLPPETFPNGLAFHGDNVYITDSAKGAVWKARPGIDTTLTTPWLTSSLLMPGNPKEDPAAHGLGANGIAFRGNDMYVGSYDRGIIARVSIAQNGTPGKVAVISKRPELKTVDGLALDRSGNLWMVTNHPGNGRIEVITSTGTLRVLASKPAWLDYPTQPVLKGTPSQSGSLYVANGSFTKGTPNILVFTGLLVP